MTGNVKQRRPLNGHHTRKPRGQRTVVAPARAIPSAGLLVEIGAPAELVEAVEKWQKLADAEREQSRAIRVARDAAATADADYRSAVREALASGVNPGNLVSDVDRHRAAITAHERFYSDARAQRERLGYDLGPMLEQAAPDLFAAVEKQIEDAAGKVRKQAAALTKAWGEYGTAFELRRWLSHVALDGTTVGNFHGQTQMPTEAAQALAVIENALGELERLKTDEHEVQTYRQQNA